MVVDEDVATDRVFAALADATRRDIVRRVIAQEASVSALARTYQMSFAAVQKHVAVLERAGLVTKERRGRLAVVHPDLGTLAVATRLLDSFEALWRARIGRMEDLLAAPPPPRNQPAD
ncbi:MAG: metalloregulator ArsR/SmtB family transcription factor [Actinobacteria bacterium]|nr:metalloregulator ArsR/SmtB family transcription factor [Actinomycetota bacterium]MCG2803109.1 metalloregulator ArsR/SmtB family transcription factor [Cellulomonas sp.]